MESGDTGLNKLTYLNAVDDGDDTTVYMLPVNPHKTLYLQETDLRLHIVDMQGNPKDIIPVFYNSDGVYFRVSQLDFIGTGTYGFYLELKYQHGSEYYPDNEVKYFTLGLGKDGQLVLLNVFGANHSGFKDIKPPKNVIPVVNDSDNDNVSDIPFNDIRVTTIDSYKPARVVIDKKTKIIQFFIPQGAPGPKGDKGDPGVAGPKGDTPVKGVDYYTDKDKQELLDSVKQYIDDAIENGKW